MRPAKKPGAWRNELVSPGEFQCACGCALQLSKGDLQDAMLVAARLGGNPRVSGVNLKTTQVSMHVHPDASASEPTESEPCPRCQIVMVAIPAYAVPLLRARGSMWPQCAECRKQHGGRSPRPQAVERYP